jgi:sec-independent protein translocase protein TatA
MPQSRCYDGRMPNIGPMEIVGLLLLALLLFGAKRLPEIGRSLGSGMREFKDSVSGDKKVETRSELPPPVPAAPPAPAPEETAAAPSSSSEREDEPPAAASA